MASAGHVVFAAARRSSTLSLRSLAILVSSRLLGRQFDGLDLLLPAPSTPPSCWATASVENTDSTEPATRIAAAQRWMRESLQKGIGHSPFRAPDRPPRPPGPRLRGFACGGGLIALQRAGTRSRRAGRRRTGRLLPLGGIWMLVVFLGSDGPPLLHKREQVVAGLTLHKTVVRRAALLFLDAGTSGLWHAKHVDA